ncbi:unnamed protein product [Schistosoma turkestanicum]|nr:unnamed protein product [Schistosoma turkestanicum]
MSHIKLDPPDSIGTINHNQTCLWWSLKTLHDLPSTYTVNNVHKITDPINHVAYNPYWFSWTTVIPILIVICTILGNSLACFIALNDRHLRHRSNVLFISLSITNIIFSSTVMICSIMYNLMSPENFSDNFIKLFYALDKLFCTVTILHLVVMAFDRFIYIKAPLKYSRCLKSKYLFFTLIGIWFLSFLIAILPIQLYWQTENYHTCLTINNNVFNTYLTNKNNCTLTTTHTPLPPSSVETITSKQALLTFYKLHTRFTCLHKVNRFYAVTNAIFSFIIPLILMITIYTRLFILTKQHISRLNVFSNVTNYSNDLSSTEYNDNKQFIYLLQPSTNNLPKRKSFFNLRNMNLTSNDDLDNSVRNSLTTSTDTLKISSRLSRSQLNYSLRLINVTSKHGFSSSTPNKPISTYKMSASSLASLTQSNRRKHSLPVYTLPINSSLNTHNNVNGITRPQIVVNYPEKQLYNAHKAAITLGLILGSFTVCWLPYFTVNCMASFCDCITKEAIFAATWLGYFNACLNSLVYSLLNNNIRMSCAKLLCAWHYNRERRQQYGLNQLKHFGDTPIKLALGRVP